MVLCVFLHLPSSLVGLVQQDTVIDAGKYDGALGIVAAIAAVKALKMEGKLQQFPRPIEVGSAQLCLHSRNGVMSCSFLCFWLIEDGTWKLTVSVESRLLRSVMRREFDSRRHSLEAVLLQELLSLST